MDNLDIAQLRTDYQMAAFDEGQALTDPLEQFRKWLAEAVQSQLPEPNALTLATVAPDGRPSARVVLLKGLDSGMIFFTNYDSRKGREIAHNQSVAMVFLWLELQRQVRVEGRAEMISRAESEAYFQSRPLGSQLGAWASPQSEVVPGRGFLEESFRKAEERFAGADPLPVPPHWGGYRVIPETVEFWQGRGSRMHDRLRYTRQSPIGDWRIERLAP
jgi:pyridoxamine 5'-phosphate oxidase